jgi:hypothetical protein
MEKINFSVLNFESSLTFTNSNLLVSIFFRLIYGIKKGLGSEQNLASLPFFVASFSSLEKQHDGSEQNLLNGKFSKKRKKITMRNE